MKLNAKKKNALFFFICRSHRCILFFSFQRIQNVPNFYTRSAESKLPLISSPLISFEKSLSPKMMHVVLSPRSLSPEEQPTCHHHYHGYGGPFLDHPVFQVDDLRSHYKPNKSIKTSALHENQDRTSTLRWDGSHWLYCRIKEGRI